MSLLRRCLLLMLLSSLGCAHGLRDRSREGEAMQAGNLYRSGMELLQAGDLTRAEQYLAAALRAGHEPRATIKGLMATCIAAGRLRSALGYAEPFLADHPDQAALRMLVASLHYGLGNYARSEHVLLALFSAPQVPAEAHYMMALLLTSQGARQPAVNSHLLRYLELAPAGPHAGEARAVIRSVPLVTPDRRRRS